VSRSALPLSLQSLPPDVWHADALAGAPAQVQPTGDRLLDAQLPGGGWPIGALVELLQPQGVHSEWRLLLPALARCGSGPVVLVGAPHPPFAPALAAQGLRTARLLWVTAQALAARLWAAEQALRCAPVDAVLVWLPEARKEAVRSDQLRRLQIAAAEHHKLLFVMRPASAQHAPSPAALRLHMGPRATEDSSPGAQDALEVQVHKRRGPPLAQPLYLAARPARLSMLLAAQRRPGHALDRTAACA
jgi:protein ImuA